MESKGLGLYAVSCIALLIAMGCAPEEQAEIGESEAGAAQAEPVWIEQESGTDASLRGICAVSEEVAWASGSGGTVLRTVDGGETWTALEVEGAGEVDFRDVQAFDTGCALVMGIGSPARIYKTEDGGESWRVCYANDAEGVFLNSIAFWDREHGIVVGDPLDGYLLVLLTSDGGKTWDRVPAEALPQQREGEAEFAASGTCVAVYGDGLAWFATGGGAARVFRSADWGATWAVDGTPMLQGGPSQGSFSVAFVDEENGYIVGGDYEDPERREANAFFSTDGGVTWTLAAAGLPGGFRSCVAYVPGSGGLALVTAGPTGSDYSIDGGRSWMPIGETGFHTLSFAPDGACWAAGGDGRIAKLKF